MVASGERNLFFPYWGFFNARRLVIEKCANNI